MLPIFPNFRALKLDEKEGYEKLISEFPPFSDIAFATLHIWWNLDNQLKISSLNDNLVISYELTDDERNSGYGLVGKNKIDETIQIIFDELKRQDMEQKLVHVPNFVFENVTNRSKLQLTEELDYNEYIVDSSSLSKLEGTPHRITRRKVKRFWNAALDKKVEIRELDLSDKNIKEELYSAIISWEKTQPNNNDPEQIQRRAMAKTIEHSDELGIKHVGLFINDKLCGIQLYHKSHDNNHYVLHHLKVDYTVPYIFDYLTHHMAIKAVEDNIEFLNIEMDLGIEGLRQYKMGLRPAHFFRKYTITPKTS